MASQHIKKTAVIFFILTATWLATGCQPKSDGKKEQKTTTQTEKPAIPVIQAKVTAVKLPKNKLCLEDGCTTYNFQTVKTNQSWINAYFDNRIKK